VPDIAPSAQTGPVFNILFPFAAVPDISGRNAHENGYLIP